MTATGCSANQDAPTGSLSRHTLICFSHLRWDMVQQRPHHLMRRFARHLPVFYIEEPLWTAPPRRLEHRITPSGVRVLTPCLPSDDWDNRPAEAVRELLDRWWAETRPERPILWYYTPTALAVSRHFPAAATVYDCMDELSAFDFALPDLAAREGELTGRADLVFAGGRSLYEAKRGRNPATHLFPSAVDLEHFAQARATQPDPPDQRPIRHPRLGWFGVIDERFDRFLLAELAAQRPDWQFVMIGPVAKIDETALPRRENIHYLGAKPYETLPAYLAGWDAALLLFARNRATRFISPTKTPEYLAGGKPVVSTPIADVAAAWGSDGLVAIAGDAPSFERAITAALAGTDRAGWLERVDRKLAPLSWDATWQSMARLLGDVLRRPGQRPSGTPITGAPVVRTSGGGRFDYLIVGAGFAGSVLAERLAAGSGKRVLLIDRRPHIGGNAHDFYNEDGVLVHAYGPHIFHTNSEQVFSYLSHFTRWRPYEHRVLAQIDGKKLPIPINRTTLNRLYGLDLSSEEAEAFLAARAEPLDAIRNAADVVLSRVGRELYEKFFRFYTRKQWDADPEALDKAVTARIPVRFDDDDRYFTDRFQMMPRDGFTLLFENMLDHPGITLALATDYRDALREARFGKLIHTGPIDEFFDYRFGKLPYRSIELRHVTLDRERFQPVAVVNYPSPEVPYTRITEYKHLTGQRHPKTTVSYEYPCWGGEPYYPVPNPANAEIYRRYRELADGLPDVEFVGRLGSYRYYNMDQVVAQALSLYARLGGREPADAGDDRRRAARSAPA